MRFEDAAKDLTELRRRVEYLEGRLPVVGPRHQADEHLFMVIVAVALQLDEPVLTAAALVRHARVNLEFKAALMAADIVIADDAGDLGRWLRSMVGLPVRGYLLTRGARSRDGRIYQRVSFAVTYGGDRSS